MKGRVLEQMAGTETHPDSVPELLQRAYELLKQEDLQKALVVLESALSVDFESEEVMYALKCASFWNERAARALSLQNQFERGEYILSQWKSFFAFQKKLDGTFEDADYAFRQYTFSGALRCFNALSADIEDTQEAELALRIGRCLKGKGDYEKALKYLESAAQSRKDDAEVLAELADTYSLVNEMRAAKALFREAFYLNPQKVELESLESALITRLSERVASMGKSLPELKEWLPVYGVLYGVFNVKRELRPIELGKLKQSIYQLENETRENSENRGIFVPRLINRYFWLIDHYVAGREDRAKIDEVLLKIKLLDASVYKQYTS